NAIRTHGHPDISAPAGPDFHQFGKPDLAVRLLSVPGFSNIDVTTIDCVWDLSAPDDLFEIYARGTARAAALLSKQTSQNLAATRSALTATVRAQFSSGDRWRVPVPRLSCERAPSITARQFVRQDHALIASGASAAASCNIMSAPFSPIITAAALVLPDTTVGMIEASITRSRSKPRTRRRSSTTAAGSEPMRQVEVGW